MCPAVLVWVSEEESPHPLLSLLPICLCSLSVLCVYVRVCTTCACQGKAECLSSVVVFRCLQVLCDDGDLWLATGQPVENYFYIAKERREGGIVRKSVSTDTQAHTSTYTVMQTTRGYTAVE